MKSNLNKDSCAIESSVQKRRAQAAFLEMVIMEPERRDPPETQSQNKPTDDRVINVAEWFGDRREIALELDGVRYRLRITRKNKLILQK